MGFWLYCKPPIECCSASVYSLEHTAQFGYGVSHGDAPPGVIGAKMFPLHGHVHAVSAQHDWIYLVEYWGIASDGSLWNWGTEEGGGHGVILVDAGPWESLSSISSTSCLGIKTDKTLWAIGIVADPFLDGWNGGNLRGASGALSNASVFLDSGIRSGVEEIPITDDTWYSELFRMPVVGAIARLEPPSPTYEPSPNPPRYPYITSESILPEPVSPSPYTYIHLGTDEAILSVTVEDGMVWFVGITSGGSGYTSKCTVVFDPPGAAATATLDENGKVVLITVTGGGGEYSSPPTVTILPDGNAGSGFSGVSLIEGRPLLSVDSPGSRYTIYPKVAGASRANQVEDMNKIKALCTAPPPNDAYIGQLYMCRLGETGSGYFAATPPHIDIVGGGGKGATATATLDANAYLVSIQVTNGGSGYFKKTGGGVEVPDPPSVRLSPGGATAVAAVGGDNWSVTSITVTHAGTQKYLLPAAPTICITHSVGTGGEAVAEVDNLGRVSSVRLTRPGSGYIGEDIPKLTFSEPFSGSPANGACYAVSADRYRERPLWNCTVSPGGVDSVDVEVPVVTGVTQSQIDGRTGKLSASSAVFMGASRQFTYSTDDGGFFDPDTPLAAAQEKAGAIQAEWSALSMRCVEGGYPDATPAICDEKLPRLEAALAAANAAIQAIQTPPQEYVDAVDGYNAAVALVMQRFTQERTEIFRADQARTSRLETIRTAARNAASAEESTRVVTLRASLNTERVRINAEALSLEGSRSSAQSAILASITSAQTSRDAEIVGKSVCERAEILATWDKTIADLGKEFVAAYLLYTRQENRAVYASWKSQRDIRKASEALRISRETAFASAENEWYLEDQTAKDSLASAIAAVTKRKCDGLGAAFDARKRALDSWQSDGATPPSATWVGGDPLYREGTSPTVSRPQGTGSSFYDWPGAPGRSWGVRVPFGPLVYWASHYSQWGGALTTTLYGGSEHRAPVWSIHGSLPAIDDANTGTYVTATDVGRMYKRSGGSWVEFTLGDPPEIKMSYEAKASVNWTGYESSFSGTVGGVPLVVSEKRTCLVGWNTVADFYTVSHPDMDVPNTFIPEIEVVERRKLVDCNTSFGVNFSQPDALDPEGLCEWAQWGTFDPNGRTAPNPLMLRVRYVLDPYSNYSVYTARVPVGNTEWSGGRIPGHNGGPFRIENVVIRDGDPDNAKGYGKIAGALSGSISVRNEYRSCVAVPGPRASVQWNATPQIEGGSFGYWAGRTYLPTAFATCRVIGVWFDYACYRTANAGSWRLDRTRASDLAVNDADLTRATNKKASCIAAESARFAKRTGIITAGRASDLLYSTDTYWKGDSDRKTLYEAEKNESWDLRLLAEKLLNDDRLSAIDWAYSAEAAVIRDARHDLVEVWDSLDRNPRWSFNIIYYLGDVQVKFSPKSLAMNTGLSAISLDSSTLVGLESFGRTLDKKSVVGRLDATIVDGLLTGYTVPSAGYGYQSQPEIGVYAGMREIGSGWSSVSYGGNISCGVKDGKVFWWLTRASNPSLSEIGKSVRIDTTKVPGEYPVSRPFSSLITVSQPVDGSPLQSITTAGPQFFSIEGETSWSSFHPAINRAGVTGNYHMSHGYSSPPTVSGHDYDGGNWLGLAATLVGPTEAKSVSLRGTGGMFEAGDGIMYVLCKDGSLWGIDFESAGFGVSGDAYYTAVPNYPVTSTRFGHPNNGGGTEYIESVSFAATISRTHLVAGDGLQTREVIDGATGTITSKVTSWPYLVSLSDVGGCYPSSGVTTHSRMSHAVRKSNPSSSETHVALTCKVESGGSSPYNPLVVTPVDFSVQTGSTTYSLDTVTWVDGEAGIAGSAIIRGGMVSGVPGGVVTASALPEFWIEDPSGKGTGATYHVTKLSSAEMMSYSGGWNRMGKTDDHFKTVAAPPVGITTGGPVLCNLSPGISLNSPPSLQSFTSVAPVSGYPYLFATAHDSADGSLWVTDGLVKRQQSPIEIKPTSFGNDLTCPPLVEIAAPDGAAKAVAVLNGKVVAVGVDAAGLGYSVAPSIEFAAFGKGSGAKATAHIRGSLTSITVDAEGTKYNTRPKVRLTNHVCPSGDIGEATASLKSGYVVSASVTGSGEGYEVPPSAFGASQQFSTTIKGFVKSVSVTDGGSYLFCPEVVISGAVAVAFLEPHKAESGRYAVATVEVTDGGSAYSTPPTVTFSGGGEDATQATGVSVLNAGVDTVFTTGIAATDLSEVPIIKFLNGGATASCVCEFGVGPVTVTKEGLYWSSPDVEFASKGIVSSIALTNAGKGYTSAPDVLVVGSCNENATASCTISGEVKSLTINPISGGGFGYKSKYPPFVKFSGGLDPTYGVSATATATCGGGIITGISLTSAGSGYRSAPSVSFVSPMTATAIAEINEDGEIVAAKIINRGAYYAATPEVVVGGSGSGGKISAVMANGSVSKLTVDDKGKGYTFAPSLAFTYDQSGADAVASCSLEYTVKAVGVISSGAGFSTAAPPKVLFVGGGGTGAAATATVTKSGSGAIATSKINGSVVYVEVTSQGSGYEFSPTVTAVPSKIDTPISSVAELQSRILGRVTSIALSSPGTGYTDGKNGTCQPLSRPVAFLNGVGYQFRDPATSAYNGYDGYGQYAVLGMAEVTFTVGTDGSLSGDPSSTVEDFYVQRPAVVFVDALGVQAPTLMDSSSVGVDHIGSAGSGSIKPTPSVDNVYSGSLTQNVNQTNYMPNTRKLAVAPTIVFPDECKTVATATIDGSIASNDWTVKLGGTGSGYFSVGPCRQILRGFVSKCVTDPPTATTTIDAVTGRVLTVAMTGQGGGWPLFSSLACYLSGGGGTGAKATVAVSSGGIISVTLVSPGEGYTTAPIVTIIGGLPESEDWVTNFRIEVNGALAVVQYVPTTTVLRTQTDAKTIETAVMGLVDGDGLAFGHWTWNSTRVGGGLHRFHRNGRVISLEIAAPSLRGTGPESAIGSSPYGHPDGFSRKSQTDPAITITVASGTAPTATAKSVRWLPQQSGGVAIRDVSEETFD